MLYLWAFGECSSILVRYLQYQILRDYIMDMLYIYDCCILNIDKLFSSNLINVCMWWKSINRMDTSKCCNTEYRVIYLCPLLFLSHLLSLPFFLTLPQLNFIVHDLYIVGNDTYCTVLREKPMLYANTVCFYWIAEWS